MRDSPSLTVVPAAAAGGGPDPRLRPGGDERGAQAAGRHRLHTGAYEALRGADGAVILTEWNEFALDPARMAQLMQGRVFVDLRNVYKPADMEEAGFRYRASAARSGSAG